jgi:hypothetical protein
MRETQSEIPPSLLWPECPCAELNRTAWEGKTGASHSCRSSREYPHEEENDLFSLPSVLTLTQVYAQDGV